MDYCKNLEMTIKSFWRGDGYSIDSVEGRRAAIKRATKDLMARTLTRKDEATGDFSEAVIIELLPKINDWFGQDVAAITLEAYDVWHSKACAAVLKVLQAFYTNQGENRTPVAYGKAQKIVNMTMKGLRCLEGADQKKIYFSHCHMVLDSFTLEWFKREIVETDKDNLLKGKVDSWSALQNPDADEYQRVSGDKSHSFYSYHTIVHLIRKHFAQQNLYEGLNPLHAEFFIWPEMQLTMAAEAFYGQGLSSEDAVAYMRAHLGSSDSRLCALNRAKDKFQVCKNLFRKLSLEEKLHFLENRLLQLKALYPLKSESALNTQ